MLLYQFFYGSQKKWKAMCFMSQRMMPAQAQPAIHHKLAILLLKRIVL